MTKLVKTIPWLVAQRVYSSQVSKSVAVVKVPTYVKKHVDKLEKKEEKWRMDVHRKVIYRGDTSIPIISCNKKEYNFYLGQVYNKKVPIPLMSRYWMKMKSAGQKFTINPYGSNPSLPMKLEQPPVLTPLDPELSMSHYISDFSQMNLSEQVLEALKAIGFAHPTPIQALTIPKILDNQHLLCVAETGAGKTMSYVIPIIQKLLSCRDKIPKFKNTPLALIVVPGRELAQQIALVAHKLGVLCGVNVTAVLPEGTTYPFLKNRRGAHIDLLVTTFGIIQKLSSNRIFNLNMLHYLVLDEADTLLDDSFKKELDMFLSRIKVQLSVPKGQPKPMGAQLIFVSATMPKNARSVLSDCLLEDRFETALSPYFHDVLPHVQQKFIRVNNENRAGIILELVKADFKKNVPVMVFCNHSPTCDWMSYFFDNNDILNVRFHAGLTVQEREDAFMKFQSGEVDVMCCTDLASRGLDTQRVRHVINFDFPNSTSDYILRVGRTGRVGSNHGHVTSLVVAKSGVYVVQDIEAAMRKSTKIPNVDANIKQKINKLYHTY